LGALHVHVDPLVVPGQAREVVDVLLRDLAPLPRADLLPYEVLRLLDAVHGDLCHANDPTPGCPPVDAGVWTATLAYARYVAMENELDMKTLTLVPLED